MRLRFCFYLAWCVLGIFVSELNAQQQTARAAVAGEIRVGQPIADVQRLLRERGIESVKNGFEFAKSDSIDYVSFDVAKNEACAVVLYAKASQAVTGISFVTWPDAAHRGKATDVWLRATSLSLEPDGSYSVRFLPRLASDEASPKRVSVYPSVITKMTPAAEPTPRAAEGGAPAAPKDRKAYATPEDVYAVYRHACQKKDWREAWSCLTPSAKDNAVLDCFMSCSLRDETAIPKNFRADPVACEDDYRRQYKAKHGVDLAAIEAQRARAVSLAQPAPAMPEVDWELYRSVLVAKVTDQAGFYEAVHSIPRSSLPEPQKLERVSVQGNSAVGQTSRVIESVRRESANAPEVRRAQSFPAQVRFRKVDGGWLLDFWLDEE